MSDVRIQLQESIVHPMLWFLLLLPESNTGETSNPALKFYILWNMKISLLFLILLLTCFTYIPFYRCPLHLYVQIHIIVVRWDWNVLKLLEKSYHCAGVGCSDQIARNLNIILCVEAQMLPSCLQKKSKKGFVLYHYRLSCLWFLAIILICDNCGC